MKRVLITGISGFIGSHLAFHLTMRDYEVYGTYTTERPKERDLLYILGIKDKVNLLRTTNVEDIERLIVKEDIDCVIHLAATSIVSSAQRSFLTAIRDNVVFTSQLLNAIKNTMTVDKVIIKSTDKVFGNKMNARENDYLDPKDVYGCSKACSDMISRVVREVYNLPIVVVRSCNVYGFDFNKRIVPNVIRQCIRGFRPRIYSDNKDHKRQFIYIEDYCNAMELIIDKVREEAIHIATDDVLTQEQVVWTICEFFNVEPRYVESTREIKELEFTTLDWSKLKSYGFEPKFTFRSGVLKTIKCFISWFKNFRPHEIKRTIELDDFS